MISKILFKDIQNLSQKINVKLGGINGVVNLKAALMHVSNEDLFMFFGANVIRKFKIIRKSNLNKIFVADQSYN
jgi:hypothetical protein